MAIAFIVFTIFVVVMELFTGCAIIGWTGDNMVVPREKSPGPYRFAVILHSLAGILLPILYLIVKQCR